MALTLLVVVASQFPRVRDDIGDVVGVVLGFDASAARALLFTGATRNSLVVLPLALALGDEYAVTGAVIVAQTLVEVLGMVVYVRLVPRLLPDERTLVPG